jgi:hypothetical protein
LLESIERISANKISANKLVGSKLAGDGAFTERDRVSERRSNYSLTGWFFSELLCRLEHADQARHIHARFAPVNQAFRRGARVIIPTFGLERV